MNILNLSTRCLHTLAQFFHSIIYFIKVCNGLIMTVFYESLNIFSIITLKGTGSIIFHCRLKHAKKLFIIDDISEVLRIIVQTVYTANRLEQTVILHFFINIQICTRRSIKSGEQLIYNYKQLHICWFFHKFPFCFLLKFLHLRLN